MNEQGDFSLGYAVGRDSNNNGNCCYPVYPMYANGGFGGGFGNSFGNDGAWWILILLLAGWGNNGFGGGFGGGGFGGYGDFQLGRLATTNDVASGFSTSEIMSDLNDILLGQQQGFASVQQTLCQGFSGVNSTINQGVNSINQGLCNLGYNIQGGFNDLSRQIGDCCCTTQRAIDGVNYNIATQSCDIRNLLQNVARDVIDSQRSGTDRIINYLVNQEQDELRSEIQNLRLERAISQQNAYFAANQDAQTAELIRRNGRDCPIPAYVVPNPNCCYPPNFNPCGNYGCYGVQ